MGDDIHGRKGGKAAVDDIHRRQQRSLARHMVERDPYFPPPPKWRLFASYPDRDYEGILLISDGTSIPFFGALGKMVPALKWLPAFREYFLGSASHGRYQVYEQGLAVWEAFEGGDNVGYPVAKWESIDERARGCSALIAFFDLRGFTNWSAKQDPKLVQITIEIFEHSFQDAFYRSRCKQVFAKGTGDGLMVVSEAGRYGSVPAVHDGGFQAGHVKAFCLACAETVDNGAKHIPDDLAGGCGVTVGQVAQLYILGRFDYIGPPVNDASKI